MANRSEERKEFLSDLLDTALDHRGYGQFSVGEFTDDYAVIHFHESGDEGGSHTVTLDTMARGLAVIRNAVLRDLDGYEAGSKVPHNVVTGQRLFFGGQARRDLLEADRTNGLDGDYDVIGALAVLECALFGRVIYG